MAADSLVYGVLVVLVWGAWQITQLGLFTSGDDTGYWLGVAGAVMMLLLFSYPLRKHFRFARGLGSVKGVFLVHMVLGVGGPLLILVHSNFRTASLNATVALYSMIIVALSGVVGKFLFSRINRGLHGAKSDLGTLQRKAGLAIDDAHSRLAFAPQIDTRLKAFHQRELDAADTLLSGCRRVFLLPLSQYLTYRKSASELDTMLPRMAAHQGWSADDLQRRRRKAKKLVHQYLEAVVRVSQYAAYARLFSFWHVAHIPFVYLLVATTLVHIFAVHAY
jgi:hypothetical protein